MRFRFGAKALGVVLMSVLAATLSYSLEGPWRKVYLPGPTTDGHYQIELACDSCHTESFSDKKTLQEACVRCHGAELAAANDSHPEKKFTDPRNADRVEQLDARFCITCHREHRPEVVSEMGLSLPVDYCYRCHSSVGEERPSHREFAFDSCASAGCHNFHDNRGLYEDFLVKHLDEPDMLPARAALPEKRRAKQSYSGAELARFADAPAASALTGQELSEWEKSAHARSGVACSKCHANDGAPFSQAVADAACASCHRAQNEGFRAGRHGMRLGSGLTAMLVADARQPMRAEAKDAVLGCTSCHGAHDFDTRRAGSDACLGCHDDQHSRAYLGSPHERAFLANESGASCATCHLPRVGEDGKAHSQHNQNDNLRPNEKMLRSVCMDCHGLGFAIDALADQDLVRRNFNGRPARKIESLELSRKRVSR